MDLRSRSGGPGDGTLIRALLLLIFWSVYTVVGAIIAFPVTLLTRRIDFLWQLGMWGAKGGVWISGVRVSVVGGGAINPAQTYIFMSNHVSNLDPPVIVPLLKRRMSILVKRELFRIPILSMGMRMANLVPVDRSNRDAAIESVKQAVGVLRSGHSMLVYPEGTRSRDGKLLPFKKGPFHMAMESGVPIVPLTVVGTREAWPKGSWKVRPHAVTLQIHPPIDPKDFTERDALMSTVFKAIDSGLPEQYRSVNCTDAC